MRFVSFHFVNKCLISGNRVPPQNVHNLPNVNVKQTTTPIYLVEIYGEFMKTVFQFCKGRRWWQAAVAAISETEEVMFREKYRLRHNIARACVQLTKKLIG